MSGGILARPERKPIITLESDTGRYSRIRSGPNLLAPEAPVEGRATTIARICQGRELRINFQTRAGWIKVEIVTPPPEPNKSIDALEGFGLAEADVLAGDELDKVVTWNGNSDLSSLKGKQLALRLHMARDKVYSVEIVRN